MVRKIILDMDPGIDDALAILLALRSPELEVLGISIVSGNVHASKGAINALRTLEILNRGDIPVYIGQIKPLLRELEVAESIHGSDGLGDADIQIPLRKPEKKKGVLFIIDTVMESDPGEITIIATGPLTNIASALLIEPRIATHIQELIIMGGAYGLTEYGFGNCTPVSEFNIYTDPEAAKIVFESGAPITAIGLDVTTDPTTILTKDTYDLLKKTNSTTANFIVRICKRLIDLFGYLQLHDPIAVSAAIDRKLFKTSPYYVEVVTMDGVTRGQTLIDRRPYPFIEKKKPNADIAYWIDGERFLKLFLDRVR